MKRSTAYHRCLAEAAEWRLLGLLLERPRPGWHDEVAALAREVRSAGLRAVAKAARAATEGEYLNCLGPGGVLSPRQVTYQPFADPGQLLAALACVYEAFAFRPHLEEPLDHVAVEVSFVGYLLLKEAFALATNEPEAVAVTAGARRAFMETHLAAFAAMFSQRAESIAPAYVLDCGRLLVARLPAAPAGQSPTPSPDVGQMCGVCDLGN
jgi:hypothetical protein